MIKEITLKDFRNFNYIKFNTMNNLVILLGDNGSGKTSLLEAIYLASTTKSMRTNNYKNMINKSKENSVIDILTNKILRVVLTNKKKYFYVNNKEYKTLEFINNLKTILFMPSDLEIIYGSKSLKRKFIDLNLSIIDSKYLKIFLNYKKLLNKRNNLLKEVNVNYKLLNSITEMLIKYAYNLNLLKANFLNELNINLVTICNELHFGKVEVKANILTNLDKIKEMYKNNLNLDLKYKATIYGPHRDDFIFLLNQNDAKVYASQGQVRMIMIILKLAILKILNKNDLETILLLDDVFGELDSFNQQTLINYLGENQTFITTTSLNDIPKNLLEKALIIKLERN